MSEHIPQNQLEAYVIGALDDVDAAHVERHVASCDSCAVALQREAALEVAFAAVVAAPRPSRLPRLAPLSAAAGAAVAMAAAMLLWLAPRSEHVQQPSASDEPPPAVTEMGGDASTFTASLDLQVDGSRVGVRD